MNKNTLPDGYMAYFDSWEEKIGAFIQFRPDFQASLDEGNGAAPSAPAFGLPFAVKDNIAVKGLSFSCASKHLEGLAAPYTATAVRRLLDAGCRVIGKTNLDEFAMGSSTDTSAFKRTNNPWDTRRVAGGSSGGSAAAVAAGLVPFALGSDTGSSVRQPAAFCGIVGLKPTYGAVSRYGLAAHGSSLEGIGVLSDTVERCRRVFGVMRGKDPMDETSVDAPDAAPSLCAPLPAGAGPVIGVLSPETIAKTLGPGEKGVEAESEVLAGFEKARANLAALGYTLKEIELPCLKYAAPAFYTLASAEASSNMARFDGIRFGKRPDRVENSDELMDKAREIGFGDEVKLRILLGTYVLRSGKQEEYYLRAQRIRDGVRRSLEALLGDGGYTKGPAAYDALLLPVYPVRAFPRGENFLSPFAQKAANAYTCVASLAGLPALSFPASLEGGLPAGVQLMGRAFAEGTLLNIAAAYEKAHPFPRPEGYKKFWN